MPTPTKPPGLYITAEEKDAAIRKMTADLKAWRERNQDALAGQETAVAGDAAKVSQ